MTSDQSKSTTYHLGQIRWYFLYRRVLPSNTHKKLYIKYFEGNIIHRSFAVSFFYWELAQNRLKWCSPNTEKSNLILRDTSAFFDAKNSVVYCLSFLICIFMKFRIQNKKESIKLLVACNVKTKSIFFVSSLR